MTDLALVLAVSIASVAVVASAALLASAAVLCAWWLRQAHQALCAVEFERVDQDWAVIRSAAEMPEGER